MSTITITNSDSNIWKWEIEHEGFTFESGSKTATGPVAFPDVLTAGKSAIENMMHYANRPRDQKRALAEQQRLAGV